MRRFRLGVAVLMALALVAAACGDDDETEEVAATTTAAPATTAAPTTAAPEEPLRIAFMYDGEIDDGGWNEAHENGRQYLIANMDGIETTFVENLSPGSEFQAAFEDFGSQGYDLVVCTTWCQDDVLVVAPNYPDTVYLSWGGYQTAPNVGHFDGATEDGRYLDGLVAGSQPDVELIGYVGGFAIEEVVRGVNAFMIGARELNPDVEIQVIWVNSWYDPAAEQQAAQALVDAGADMLAAEVNAPAVASVAEASGIGYIHYGIDGSGLAPNSWLSGFTFNWGPYYLSQAQALADGTWEPALTYGGLRDGVVGMSPFGAAVSADTIALVEERRQEIVDGTFDYFAGPITDNQGNVVIAEGETIAWEERTLCCQWLIEGVIGEIPAG